MADDATAVNFDFEAARAASRAAGIVDVKLLHTRSIMNVSPREEGPAVNLPEVPESIPWSKVADFLTGLGIDLNSIPVNGSDIGGVIVGWNAIECEVIARNARGSFFLNRDRKGVAKHAIHIPVIHDEDPQP